MTQTAIEPRITPDAGSVEFGEFLAVPFDADRGGPEKLETLLAAAVGHPHWFNGPTEPEDRQQIALFILMNPQNLNWEVWKGGQLIGLLMLSRIAPKCDALLHFAFFDRNLVGKVRLLNRFIAFCFDDLQFQRLSIEVPEYLKTLVSFSRRKLGFHYEGELLAKHPAVADLWSQPGMMTENPHIWIASRGSRKERAHWKDGFWYDVLCLRLTAPEFRVAQPGG